MEDLGTGRRTILKGALVALLLGAATFVSPNLIQRAMAQESTVTCTATCRNGSCTGNKPYCVCSCTWFSGSALCNCTEATEPDVPPPTG